MSISNSDDEVLIVGAGPVGLMVALELHCQGIPCRIIDKNPAPCEQSRALGIHARTLEIFETMGIIDDVLKAGQKLNVFNVYVHKRRVLHVALDELESPYPYVISLPQSQTERILIKELEKLGGLVERPVELVGVTQNVDGVCATLKFANGNGMEVYAPWLVACDGAHSIVRNSLNMAFEGSQYPEAWFLADVHADTALSQSEIHVFNEKDGLLAVFPFGNNRFRLVADVYSDSELIKPTDEGLRRRKNQKGKLKDPAFEKEPPTVIKERGLEVMKTLARLKDPTFEEFQSIVQARAAGRMKISDPSWLAAFTVHRRMATHYRKGRIFLAGDAAHIHSPVGGQGMNTGIQDAHNLGWKLALVISGAAPEALLDSYEVERHAVGKQVLRMTDFMTKVNTLRNPIGRGIRQRLAPFLAGQEVIQQRLKKNISELAVNYRKSPIVDDYRVGLIGARLGSRKHKELPEFGEWFTFDHGPAPGDRAPDANVFDLQANAMTRLFELLNGTEHHLLLFAGVRSVAKGLRSLVQIGNFVDKCYAGLIQVYLIAESDTVWSGVNSAALRLVDPDLSIHHRYGAGSECLYLLRPDGYVGFRSLPADKKSLAVYLQKIFH